MAKPRMRVAVAGTNALAQMIAHFLVTETSHQLVILSRHSQPTLTSQGYQVLVVDYHDQNSLQHGVMGVDTVISTVTGLPQHQLVDACVAQNVRRFAPAEFEGSPLSRPEDDPLDRGKKAILGWLEWYRGQIEWTVFSCGVLYERFAPGGLATHRLGLNTSLCNEGDYIVNCRTMLANAPIYDASHQLNVPICLTAAQDVAKFIVRAIDLPRWPEELSMAGERLTVGEITNIIMHVRGPFNPQSTWHDPATLLFELQDAQIHNDSPREMRAHDHIATLNGRYDIGHLGTLRNHAIARNIVPMPFETWLRAVWANIPVVR